MTEERLYTIGELAEAASVTPRTIRFYTAEGLLPPPVTHDKHPHYPYARYTEHYLHRLRLIQLLKNAFLPLATIRTQLKGLTDAQIRELLARSSAPATTEQAEANSRESSSSREQGNLEYLAQILAVAGQAASQDVRTDPSAAPRTPAPQPAFAPPSAALSDAETWERVPLAPGAELHLRTPRNEEERARWNRLIAVTKTLFASDGQEG